MIGFKCFLIDSGVPEFPPLDVAELRSVLGSLAALGARLIVHAEDPAEISRPPALTSARSSLPGRRSRNGGPSRR